MRHSWIIALAGFGALCQAAIAADAGTQVGGQSRPVDLQAKDRAALLKTACQPYGVAVESFGKTQRWTYDSRFAPQLEVAVRCAPHATTNGLPSHYNVECKRADDRPARSTPAWQCLGWEEIGVPTAIGNIAIEPGPYTHERATQTVRAALASTRFQHEVHAALPTGCRLASNWSGQADEVAELSCASGHRFLFSFWCPDADCPRLITITSPSP